VPPRLRWVEAERADLHLHSHHSDGLHSPEDLVERALAAGLVAVALTDHADTSGVIPMCQAGAHRGLHVVPGVELNSADGDLLGLWIDVHDPELQRFLAAVRTTRAARTASILQRLQSLGMGLEPADVEAIASPGTPARPHIARALVRAGRCASVDEAFARWLGHGRPAWLPGQAPSLETCVQAIQRAGGVAVEAHPLFHVARHGGDPDARCARLAAMGVCGIELLPAPEPALAPAARALEQAAAKHGLLALGGSNFHGSGLTRAHIGAHSVGGPTLRALQDRLPGHSIHRGAIKRAAWRSERLTPDELSRSFEPTTVVLDALYREDLLRIAPPTQRPHPYPVGRSFVLLGPGALARQAWVEGVLRRADATRLHPVPGDDYPTVAWNLYEMFGGSRPKDARDLLRFELDRHLWGRSAERCCVLYYDPPPGSDPEALKSRLRRGIGPMRFYRVVAGPLRDTNFTSWLHMPDPEDVDRECWHLARLGLPDCDMT
jgi:3',5'-nucleoside bisphosphate phosphatase